MDDEDAVSVHSDTVAKEDFEHEAAQELSVSATAQQLEPAASEFFYDAPASEEWQAAEALAAAHELGQLERWGLVNQDHLLNALPQVCNSVALQRT